MGEGVVVEIDQALILDVLLLLSFIAGKEPMGIKE